MIGFCTHIHAAMLVSAALVLSGCANANPYFNPAKSHHTPSGFKNNSTDGVVRSFSDLLRWKWGAFRDDWSSIDLVAARKTLGVAEAEAEAEADFFLLKMGETRRISRR